MDDDKEYDSESDQSDEDFCPDKEFQEELSEDESCDGEENVEADNQDGEDEGNTSRTKTKQQQKRKSSVKNDKQKSKKPKKADTDAGVSVSVRPSTRQNIETNGKKTTLEKDELESEEESDKSHADALWASFLSDVQPELKPKKASKAVNGNKVQEEKPSPATASPPTSTKPAAETSAQPKQIKVTEILDFAGEEVKVERCVSSNSIKENKDKSEASATKRRPLPTGTAKGGGLSSILNQIGKKKKISVLEKTALDWKSYKQEEDIEEELRTYNKGKDGYLERQDFLERTDLRQFEIEKKLRQSSRRTNL